MDDQELERQLEGLRYGQRVLEERFEDLESRSYRYEFILFNWREWRREAVSALAVLATIGLTAWPGDIPNREGLIYLSSAIATGATFKADQILVKKL